MMPRVLDHVCSFVGWLIIMEIDIMVTSNV